MAGELGWKVYLTSGNDRRIIREFEWFQETQDFVDSQGNYVVGIERQDCVEYEAVGKGFHFYYRPQSQKWRK